MRLEQIEIYSDATNAAVMRHPGRHFPGVLVQGDTISHLASWLSRAVAEIETCNLSDEAQEGLLYVHQSLTGLAEHYSAVVRQHGIRPPSQGA
ncbi:DUF6959 family protein [Cognatilysobacter lacus]|uniref:DUF6959 family protein n=1 Tax=Cognatilysobacter lacus TaxID=1643323 RepID=UPI003CCCAB4B